MAGALESLRRDLVTAVRGLRLRPGYVLVATLTLAVGIGSATVVFSIVDAMSYRNPPYADPDRLVTLWERSLQDPEIDRWPVAPATFLDWRAMMRSYEDLAAYDYASPVFADESVAERLPGAVVTGNVFALLGAAPLAGRGIEEQDVETGASVAVISHGLWVRAFGRDESIVGRTIRLDGEPTAVVGIMPAGFRFPYDEHIDVWRPLVLGPEDAADRATGTLFVIGRLRPGVSFDAARAEAELTARELAAQHPATHEQRGINVLTQRETLLEWRRPMLTIFAAAAGLILAVVGMNLAGLMLTRGLSRSTELAVRLALGGGHGRVARLLLVEALLVAGLGSAAGAGLAALLLPALLEIAPGNWGGPMLAAASVDRRALAFTALVAAGTAALASLAPVMRIPRLGLAALMAGAGHATGSRRQLRLRRGLVVAQVTVALLLLGVAGLLTRSVRNTFGFELGFDPANVLSARVPLDPNLGDRPAFYQALAREAGALPGVESVTLASIVPLSGDGMQVAVSTDGSSPSAALAAETYNQEIQFRVVGREFFDLLSIPVLAGRGFGPGDVAGSERVAVVNRHFARLFFADEDPVDATIRTALYFRANPPGFDEPWRIVGVAGDVAEWGIWSQPPIIYVPYPQVDLARPMSVMLRTAVPPTSLRAPLEDAVWGLGSRWPLERVTALEDFLGERLYVMHAFVLSMSGFFAAVATLLAAVGVYGVVAFQVRQRGREMSIRCALGAGRRDVRRIVLREGLGMCLIGTGLGLALALATGRFVIGSFLGTYLFQVGWFDPLTFALAAMLLATMVAIACLDPARRAARVDPAAALKQGD